MQVSTLSLNTTSFYGQKQLRVSANDCSHHQVDHENMKRKFTAALVVRGLDCADLVLYTISNM